MILFFSYATVNSMKRYKPLLLQVGILFFVFAVVFFVLEQRKQFVSVDFSKHYAQNKTIELSGFETGEGWQGNYSYDTKRVLEGKSSITFSSWYGKKNSIQKNQTTVIPSGYTNGYISIFVKDKQTLSNLSSFTLDLAGQKDEKKQYPLTSSLQLGWNRVAVTFPDWKKITKISFTILSKPETIVEVNMDRFWIENTTIYTSDIFSTQNKFVSLRTIGNRTYLFSASTVPETYTAVTPSAIRKGSVTVALIPEHAKEAVLALNNTSMKITGENMSTCLLSANDSTTLNKNLQTASGKDDLYLFMRAQLQNGKVVYSLSNNGVDFEQCGSVGSSMVKPIQLTLTGSYLIDSFSADY